MHGPADTSAGAPRSSRYHAIWEFPYSINGRPVQMMFTSVSGHLMEMDFPESYKRWSGCSPLELYSAPISKTVGRVGVQVQGLQGPAGSCWPLLA